MRAARNGKALARAALAALLLAFGPASGAALAAGDEHAAPVGEDHAAAHEPTGEHAAAEHAGAGEHHAGGEHEATLDGKKLGLQLLNFGVLVAILVFFGGRAINKALLARHQQMKADLASAAEAKAAAEKRLEKQEARLASLENEIAALVASIKEEAEVEKQRLIAAAEERAKRIQEETRFALGQQVKEAEAQLKREVAEAAVRVAEELLKRSLGGSDQQRLVDAFIHEVAAGNGASHGTHKPDGSAPAGRPAPRSEV